MAYQVVEKESSGVDWHLVRYNEKALTRFPDQHSAEVAAVAYLTDLNCNNALTKAEKLSSFEAFMETENGIYLGVLDGEPWYLTYPKDVKNKNGDVENSKGDIVKDKKHFLLEGKTEVAVRLLPGT